MAAPVRLTSACFSSFVAELTPAGVFSTEELLRQRPELEGRPAFVVELAYVEYSRRIDAGERLDPAEFAGGFGLLEESVRNRIEVEAYFDRFLDDAPSKPPPFEEGEHAFGFELLEEIGEGAFARVFLANETQLSRLVVVKFGVRGAEEASTMAMLEHPNIVQVHSALPDVLPGVTAICMPYRGRRTLHDWVPPVEGPIPRDVAFRRADASIDPADGAQPRRPVALPFVDAVALVAEDVLSALGHMHAAGVHHGDIKPSNVLVGDDGVARLLDFNLARGEDDLDGRIGGTMPYMAPELIDCLYVARNLDDAPSDPRSDLFSLGATLYHVLTGVCPFGTRDPRDGAEAAAQRLLAAPPARPVRSLNPQVDPVLADLIDACLAQRVEDRPASAEDAARRLAMRSTLWRRFARLSRRRPGIRNAAAAGLLAVVCAAAWQVATAPPYGARELKAGWDAFESQRFHDAARHFSRAESTEGVSVEARFGRALSHLAANDPERALPDFERLHAERPSPEVAEGLAYCLACCQSKFAAATQLYESILAVRPPNAGRLNNLGYCLLRTGKRELALQHLTAALEADSGIKELHLNLAVTELRQARSDKVRRPPDARHIEAALELGDPNAEILLTAAMTYAAVAQLADDASVADTGALRKRAIEYAEQGTRHGLPPGFLQDLGWYLRGTPEEAEVSRIANAIVRARPPASTESVHLVNPVNVLASEVLERLSPTAGPLAAR